MKIIVIIFLITLVAPTIARAESISIEDAFSPQQGATELVVKAIGQAHKSIHLACYSFTSRPIGTALVAAHNRGVEVEIVEDHSKAKKENRSEMDYMARHGIQIRINSQYKIMHDKYMVIDGDTVELGSFNFTHAAEYNNAENVLVLHGAGKVAADYEKQWQKLWNEGEK